MKHANIPLCLLALLCHPPVHAFQRVYTETSPNPTNAVSSVYELVVTFDPNKTYEVFTHALTQFSTGTPDTILHLMPSSNRFPSVSGSNDDCNLSGLPQEGRNSCVRYTNTTWLPAGVRVVAHAYSTNATALGLITIRSTDGTFNFTTAAIFGGQVLDDVTHDVGWGSSDKIQIVRPPVSLSNGSSYRVYALNRSPTCSFNDVKMLQRSTAGIAGGVQLQMASASTAACSPRIVIGSSGVVDQNYSARAYINDVLVADQDGDGLGDSLEAALGTCPVGPGTTPTYPCRFAERANDTDRDGLLDAWEVLGISSQRLPAWGASPLHKDAFIEIDWSTSNQPASNPFLASGAATLLQNAAAPFAAGPANASNLRNPDNAPGIALHFDVGIQTCDANARNCSVLFGDWGGAAATSSLSSTMSDMSPERVGVFFHGLVNPGGGGRGGGQTFEFGVDNFRAITLAHELGHSIGALDHFGTDGLDLDCKATYPSIMNYSFEPPASQLYFSPGSTAAVQSTGANELINPMANIQDIRTIFDMPACTTGSQLDWNRDGFCTGIVPAVTRWGDNDCQLAEAHRQELPNQPSPTFTPTMASLGPDLYTFWADNALTLRQRRFTSDLLPCDAQGLPVGCCPVTTNAVNDCGVWSAASTLALTAPLVSSPVALTTHTSSGVERISLFYALSTSSGRRYFARTVSGLGQFGNEVQLGGLTVPAAGRRADPAAVEANGVIQLFYLDSTTSELRRAIVSSNYTVTYDSQLYDAQNFTAILSNASPAVALHSDGFTYLVSTNVNDPNAPTAVDHMRLWRVSGQSTLLSEIPDALALVGPADSGRPALIQEEEHTDALELFFPRAGVIWRTWTPTSDLRFIREHHEQNQWALGKSTGVSLTLYQGRLQMLSRCTYCNDSDPTTQLELAPFASGIFPFVERDNNDFADMAASLCAALKTDGSADELNCFKPGQAPLSAPAKVYTCHTFR